MNMPTTDILGGTPRRALNIFYVLDTSGSMDGIPVATLNRAMEETIEILKEQAKTNADALLKIAVLEFNSDCRWLQEAGPEEAEDFMWQEVKAGGLTEMGEALTELNSKLSRNAFLNSMTGAYLPIIIFMSDGYATSDYKPALDKIRKNKWFARAIKIGFAMSNDADIKMLAEVVGNSEAVVKTNDWELFARLIQFSSVTASMLASTSRTCTEPVTGADIIKEAIDSGEATEDILIDEHVEYDPEPEVEIDSGDWEEEDWD